MNASGYLLKSVFGKVVWDQRRSLIGWSIAIAGYSAMIGSFWPTMGDMAPEFQKLLESYPPAVKAMFNIEEMLTPAGFIEAELFSAVMPIFFLVYAVGRGADLIAGEEERGSLDLLLAHPISRRSALLQKAGALGAGVAVLGLVLFASLALTNAIVGLGIPYGNLLAAACMLAVFAYGFGVVALAAGAFLGRKGVAIATAAALAAVAYLVQVLSKLVDWLDLARWVSPFAHLLEAHPLRDGFAWDHMLVLLLVPALFLGLAVWAFERRDVGVA